MLADSIPEQVADLQPILGSVAAGRHHHGPGAVGIDPRGVGVDRRSGGAAVHR